MLVYDLAPWSEITRQVIRAVRQGHPLLPILAYPSVKPGLGHVIAEALSFPGVTLTLQLDDAAEVRRLRAAIGEALRSTPVWRTKQVVRWLIPSLPSRARDFLDLAFSLLASGHVRCDTLSARAIASGLGLDPRTVERACSSAALTPPRETLDWLTLLALNMTAAIAGRPTAAVSKEWSVE